MPAPAEHDEYLPELRARFAAHDFFVDFLGGLVPGLLFILGFAFCLVPTLYILLTMIGGHRSPLGSWILKSLQATKDTPNTIWITGLFVLITIAYLVGQLFYRRGPKKPDQESFRQIKGGKDETRMKSEFACTSYEDCEFPYPYLKTYLSERGHDHLLPLVRWDQENFRSKTQVNLLKIRLHYHHPEKCSEVIKNEAHVRLSSSTWYVARALRYSCFAVGSIFLAVAVLFLLKIPAGIQDRIQLETILSALIPPILIFVFAEFARSRIEKILHYQRLREVFYVLETAHTAFRDQPELLDPPFREYVQAIRNRPAGTAEAGGSQE